MHSLVAAGIPQPPSDLELTGTGRIFFTVCSAALLVASVAAGVRWWHKYRTAIPLLCLVGGIFTVLLEPLLDVLGMCYHAVADQVTDAPEVVTAATLDTFGRPMPLYVMLGYVWFFGVQTWLVWWRLERNGPRALWATSGLLVLIDLVIEVPATLLDVYVYYGRQPFDIGGFPLWWPVVNAIGPLTAGAAIYCLDRRWSRGWRGLVVIPVTFMGCSAGYLPVALPLFSALNSNQPLLVTTVAAGVSVALAVLWVRLLARTITLVRAGATVLEISAAADAGSPRPQAGGSVERLR